MSYSLERFNCASIEDAKFWILEDGEAGLTTQERWEKETAWLRPRLVFDAGLVIDFGCGIGRLSKDLVSTEITVIGVDSSPSMRRQAEEYVGHENFRAVGPGEFADLVREGLRADGMITAWILQHLPHPEA